jgi:hypothetical protein
MGFLGTGDTRSDQTNTQQSGNTSGAQSPNAVAGGVALGGNASYIGGGSTLSVVNADAAPEIAGALDLVKTISGTESSDISGLTSQVLKADQATAANTASGGQTNNNKTVLYILLAAAAAYVLVFIFGKK